MTFNPYEEASSYFTFDQRLVLLNILKLANSKKKKTIEGPEVYLNYLEMCEKSKIEPVFKNNFLNALKIFEVTGFIKIKPGMRITKLDLGQYSVDDWINAIYQDPAFERVINAL